MFRIARRHIGLLATLFVFALSPCLHAQVPITEDPTYTPTLTFDVISIRPTPPSDGVHVSVTSPPHSSRLAATSFPLKSLIQSAYGFDMPIVGAPSWIETTFFDIQARSDEAADAKLAKLTDNQARLEKRNAIRVLLADRFGLKFHTETRESSIFNLSVAKNGIKMTVTPPPPPPPDGEPPPPPAADVKARGSAQGLEFVAANMSMRAMCSMLSSQTHAPVADKTGLNGLYSFTLQMGGDWSQNNPDGWPSIFTAVQEQLGLKLDAIKASVPNLVVDNITKPTEN